MSSQPKKEQAQTIKNMQECSPEEGHKAGHLVMGQVWRHWDVALLGPRGEAGQTSKVNVCLCAETHVYCALLTHCQCVPVLGSLALASGNETPLNDNRKEPRPCHPQADGSMS